MDKLNESEYCCPQCGGDLDLIDDSGRGDGIRPDPWCTWHCWPCQWDAGWAETPELADRMLERKAAEAWEGYDSVFPSEFPPPTQKQPSALCDKCGASEATERDDGHVLCGQCVRDKEDCL